MFTMQNFLIVIASGLRCKYRAFSVNRHGIIPYILRTRSKVNLRTEGMKNGDVGTN